MIPSLPEVARGPSPRGVSAWLRRCAERVAERRALAQLNDWELRDIGVSRGDVTAELRKPWWRA